MHTVEKTKRARLELKHGKKVVIDENITAKITFLSEPPSHLGFIDRTITAIVTIPENSLGDFRFSKSFNESEEEVFLRVSQLNEKTLSTICMIIPQGVTIVDLRNTTH